MPSTVAASARMATTAGRPGGAAAGAARRGIRPRTGIRARSYNRRVDTHRLAATRIRRAVAPLVSAGAACTIVPVIRRCASTGCSVNRLAEAGPSVRGGFRAASAEATPARGRAEIPPRHLLHAALLLIETGVFHPRRLHAAGKTLRRRLRVPAAHRAIRHAQARSVGRHRHNTMHQTS